MSREDAQAAARSEAGEMADDLILPESERPLIELALETVGKWRVTSGLKVILLGFDLGEIDVAARWMGIRPDARLLAGLNIIERAALRALE